MTGFDGPIFVPLGKSILLVRGVLLAHFASCALVVGCLPLNGYQIIVVSLIMLNAARSNHRLKREANDDIVALLVTSRDSWRVHFRDGRSEDAELVRVAWLSVPITAVRFRLADGHLHDLAIFCDNAPESAYRRLRVRLHYPLHDAEP